MGQRRGKFTKSYVLHRVLVYYKVAEMYKQQPQNAKDNFKNKNLAKNCNVERLARKLNTSDIGEN